MIKNDKNTKFLSQVIYRIVLPKRKSLNTNKIFVVGSFFGEVVDLTYQFYKKRN